MKVKHGMDGSPEPGAYEMGMQELQKFEHVSAS